MFCSFEGDALSIYGLDSGWPVLAEEKQAQASFPASATESSEVIAAAVAERCLVLLLPGRRTLCLFAYSFLVYSGFVEDNMLASWMRGCIS